MKIAVASEGEMKSSEVSSVGGRATYYLIFENGELIKSIKNPFRSGGGGAGFAVASMLADEGVGLATSRHFGEKMVGALEGHKIKWKIVGPGTVEEALKEL